MKYMLIYQRAKFIKKIRDEEGSRENYLLYKYTT